MAFRTAAAVLVTCVYITGAARKFVLFSEDESRLQSLPGMKYNVTPCSQRLLPKHSGQVFKLITTRRFVDRLCLIEIPSQAMLYFFTKFFRMSTIMILSGNSDRLQELSHLSGVVLPRLNEPTISGPYVTRCKQSVMVFRSRGMDDNFLFTFLIAPKVHSNATLLVFKDPISCDVKHRDPMIRRFVGYDDPPWTKYSGPFSPHQVRNLILPFVRAETDSIVDINGGGY